MPLAASQVCATGEPAADAGGPLRVELKLRETRLLPYEPLAGPVVVKNATPDPVQTLRELIAPPHVEYRREGEEWRPITNWTLPEGSGPSRPLVITAGRPFSTLVWLPTFAADGSPVLLPGKQYDIR